jgi:hypothetical protein
MPRHARLGSLRYRAGPRGARVLVQVNSGGAWAPYPQVGENRCTSGSGGKGGAQFDGLQILTTFFCSLLFSLPHDHEGADVTYTPVVPLTTHGGPTPAPLASLCITMHVEGPESPAGGLGPLYPADPRGRVPGHRVRTALGPALLGYYSL